MRRKTIEVRIGKLTLASDRPVMVQSMLNTSTMHTDACVEQAIRVIQAGGELVRITAQGVREAENLKNIHEELRMRGYDTPISADIHFTPDAALVAARYVEKVRINPGNFVDKRATFRKLSYTEEEYAAELEHLKARFTEFLEVCKVHGTAVRIGTNHGSLSDRIMSRYGDTPEGMVEATMEYLRVCKETSFRDVVISLKSSDCGVMVRAVRLLVKAMEREDMHYPLHLGVTEAGEGEDGRIRSAVGIGTLLNEGMGDTIRVSLTEAPENEIPVAKALVEICNCPEYKKGGDALQGNVRRPLIVADLSHLPVVDEEISGKLGFTRLENPDPVCGERLLAGIKAPEVIYTESLGPELTKLPALTTVVVPLAIMDMAHVYNRNAAPLCRTEEYLERMNGGQKVFVQIRYADELTERLAVQLQQEAGAVLVLALGLDYQLYRLAFCRIQALGITNPVFIRTDVPADGEERVKLAVAAHVGGFFLDRLAAGLWLTPSEKFGIEDSLALSRNILQSAGVRRYKTEFVSCPGCGRTLFDLQTAVARVKQAFSHLHTLKIAVMGCIVNGPGEMGDADYGYVGAGNGKVNLYKGKQMMMTAVPEEKALDALKVLMTEYGDWREVNG